MDDYPGFRPLQISVDLQGSAKIVALNLEEPYRSAESLQNCADFLKRFLQKAEICFSAAPNEPNYCIFGLHQLLYEVF